MTRYTLHKKKINNMEDKRLPKITSNSSEATYGSSKVGIKIPSLG
jgi:hypothetical protein